MRSKQGSRRFSCGSTMCWLAGVEESFAEPRRHQYYNSLLHWMSSRWEGTCQNSLSGRSDAEKIPRRWSVFTPSKCRQQRPWPQSSACWPSLGLEKQHDSQAFLSWGLHASNKCKICQKQQIERKSSRQGCWSIRGSDDQCLKFAWNMPSEKFQVI